MKHSNFLSKSGSGSVKLQSSDIGYRCRLFAVSLPSFCRVNMLKFVSVLAIILTIGVGQMWGTETLVYTLDGTTTATGNAYATASDVTQSSKSWKVTANTEQNPWRIGGKSITNTDRTIYNVTNSSFSDNICKVTLDVGATASSLTVNSITLIVSTAQNGGGTVTNTETKTSNLTSTTVTFNRPSGQNWSNKYFKIVFNVTRSGSSGNGYVTFSNAKFYKNTYTMAYNANGGTGTMTDSSSPYNEGATVTVKSNTFTAPANKEFDEWKTGASSGTSYAAGATFNITANTTLYAQWKDAAVACTNVISLSKGTATNGTVNTISVDEIATCSETASERRVTVTITPAACYNAPDALIYTGDGTATMQGTKTDNGDGTFSYLYQFAQNDNGSGTFGVTCAAKPAGKTVNFNAGPGVPASASLTETCDGSGVTLPTVDVSGLCKGWGTFAGWATAAVNDSNTTSVTTYAAGSKYTPASDNMTLYAVYSKAKAGGITPTNKKLTFGTSYASNASDLSEVTIFTGITASATNGTSNNPKYYTSSPGTWRMYVGSELTIASTIGKITQIAFTKNSDFNLAVKSGESGTLSSETWTYASGVNSVTFTVGGTTKLSAIEVTYQAASSATYYCSDPNCCTELGSINGSVF